MESKSKTKVKKKKQSPPKTEPLVKQEIKIEPREQYVKISSNDNHELYIPRRAARLSTKLDSLLADEDRDISKTIELKLDYSGAVLESIASYLSFKLYYEQINTPDEMKSIPRFDVDKTLALEVLIASTELGC